MRKLFFVVFLLVGVSLTPSSQPLQAATNELTVLSYKHKACVLSAKHESTLNRDDPAEPPPAPAGHYAPRNAQTEVPITLGWFRKSPVEAEREFTNCQEIVNVQIEWCNTAIEYPDYLPPKSRAECNRQYAEEVTSCRAHYTRILEKCNALQTPLAEDTHKQADNEELKGQATWEELPGCVPGEPLPPGWENLGVPEHMKFVTICDEESSETASLEREREQMELEQERMALDQELKVGQERRRMELEHRKRLAEQQRREDELARQIAAARKEQQMREQMEYDGAEYDGADSWGLLMGGIIGGAILYDQLDPEDADQILGFMGDLASPGGLDTMPDGTGGMDMNPGAQTGAGSECQELANQIAGNLERGTSMASVGGHCSGAREMLRVMNYARSNLSKYGCYRGEYDRSIGEYQLYISNNC